jgi:hypothetical protein
MLDPFHCGRTVTRRECVDRLHAMGYDFHQSVLAPVSDRRMLMRVLGNVLHAFSFREDRLLVGAIQEARRALTMTA